MNSFAAEALCQKPFRRPLHITDGSTLGDAAEFLRLTFDSMSPMQQAEFLDSQAVVEFIDREGGEGEGHEQTV